MSDLIDRQAVLDSLKEHRSLYCDNTPDTFSKLSYAEKSRVDELDTAIATIINLPSAENKGEWIPVSERLPDNNVRVLCSAISTSISGGHTRFVGCCDNGFWFVQTDAETVSYPRQYKVTAWMSLPEPYKAEKTETCKGCLEPCIMYEPNMRGCKNKVKSESEEE